MSLSDLGTFNVPSTLNAPVHVVQTASGDSVVTWQDTQRVNLTVLTDGNWSSVAGPTANYVGTPFGSTQWFGSRTFGDMFTPATRWVLCPCMYLTTAAVVMVECADQNPDQATFANVANFLNIEPDQSVVSMFPMFAGFAQLVSNPNGTRFMQAKTYTLDAESVDVFRTRNIQTATTSLYGADTTLYCTTSTAYLTSVNGPSLDLHYYDVDVDPVLAFTPIVQTSVNVGAHRVGEPRVRNEFGTTTVCVPFVADDTYFKTLITDDDATTTTVVNSGIVYTGSAVPSIQFWPYQSQYFIQAPTLGYQAVVGGDGSVAAVTSNFAGQKSVLCASDDAESNTVATAVTFTTAGPNSTLWGQSESDGVFSSRVALGTTPAPLQSVSTIQGTGVTDRFFTTTASNGSHRTLSLHTVANV